MTKDVETYMEFTFEAAHSLQPFSPLHGHSFYVGVHLKGQPHPEYGWCADLYEVEKKVETIRKMVDHKHLNEIEGLEKPSLENVAAWIYRKLKDPFPELDRIEVRRGPAGQVEGCVYRG